GAAGYRRSDWAENPGRDGQPDPAPDRGPGRGPEAGPFLPPRVGRVVLQPGPLGRWLEGRPQVRAEKGDLVFTEAGPPKGRGRGQGVGRGESGGSGSCS